MGNTEEFETKVCFMCLERIPCSDDEIEVKMHMTTEHSAKINLRRLVEICTEVEEREEREGWSIDDIFIEERDRRESETRKRAESGRMWMLRRKMTTEILDNNISVQVECFLCQEKLLGCK